MRSRSLKLPPQLDDLVQKTADERQVSYSHVVREAVRMYLARPSASAAAAAGDLVGSLAGSSDLSTAPRHLKGFGE